MNWKTWLRGERAFWTVIGGGTLLTLLMLFGWALPAARAAKGAANSLEMELTQIGALQGAVKDIPSPRTLRDREDFRVWLDEQAKVVGNFFADRAALLDAPITGEMNPAPADFKYAYIRQLAIQQEWFQQNAKRMTVAGAGQAFLTPRWVATMELPNPAEYVRLRRAYWSRHYLYRRFLDGRASAVQKLTIADGEAKPVSDRFNGIAFAADLLIPPDRVRDLLSKMLVVPPPSESPGTIMPVFVLESMDILGMPSTVGANPQVAVALKGYILVLK